MDEGAGHEHQGRRAPVTAADWDELYGESQVWSGNPNGALVREVSSLPPGRALDVGCGEGADAVWLARQGWLVTGLDVSAVALTRAAEHARQAGVDVRWLQSGLTEASLPPQSFDLVSAHYPALPATPDHAAERALLDTVAPGGVLLFVHHDIDPSHHDGFDVDAYVMPPQMKALLDDGWRVEVDEKRARDVPEGGGGAHHSVDVVLRIVREKPKHKGDVGAGPVRGDRLSAIMSAGENPTIPDRRPHLTRPRPISGGRWSVGSP